MLRSLLFVPANIPRRVAKALTLAVDAVILDLEDACPIAEKVAARIAVATVLAERRGPPIYVRVNALATLFSHGDLAAVVGSGLCGIMLPKVEAPADILIADWMITQCERVQSLQPGSVDLIPLVETAAGLRRAEAIAASCPRVKRLALGAGDLALDLGLELSREETELLSYRADLVTASRAAGIEPPIDSAWLTIDDEAGLAISASRSAARGFHGKLCIHPNQVPIVNRAFIPSAERVEQARRIVEAFAEAEAAGSGAVTLDGALIDYPIAERARRVLEQALWAAAPDDAD